LLFEVCGAAIPIVDKYRYLGVMLHHEGCWEPQLAQLRSRLGLRVHQMRRAGMGKYGLPPRRARDLIRQEICPVVEYASAVWLMSKAQTDKLVKLWNKAVRYAAGVPEYCSIEPVVGDMDLVEASIPSRWIQYKLTMWHRIVLMEPDRMVRRCVKLWLRAGHRRQNWIFRLDKDMKRLGYTEALHWYFMRSSDALSSPAKVTDKSPLEWKIEVREKLLELITLPAWRDGLAPRGRSKDKVAKKDALVHYNASVRDPVYEDYVIPETTVQIRKKQSMFAKYLERTPDRHERQFHSLLRASSLPLQAGRHPHVRCGGHEHSSLCFMCGLEDETLEHFMNGCHAYDDVKQEHGVMGPFSYKRIIYFPWWAGNDVFVLFAMWRKRICVWRRAHPAQQPVQRLF